VDTTQAPDRVAAFWQVSLRLKAGAPGKPDAVRPAFFAYADNSLIDTKHAIIIDIEAMRAARQAETGPARTMVNRAMDSFRMLTASDHVETAAS
jgi:hypothetical protein